MFSKDRSKIYILYKGDEETFKQEPFHKKSRKHTFEGEKQFFQCKYDGCRRVGYILYDSFSLNNKYFLSENDHDLTLHIEQNPRGIPAATKAEIKSIFASGLVKPLQINHELVNRGFPEVSLNSLKNFLVSVRAEKYGDNIHYLNELEEWSLAHASSNDDHTPFVLCSEFDYAGNNFIVFLSTNQLLKNCAPATCIQADSTFKLNWCGFPVIVVGTSDKDRVLINITF